MTVAAFFIRNLHWPAAIYALWIVQVLCELGLFWLLDYLAAKPGSVRLYFAFCAVAGIAKMAIPSIRWYFYAQWSLDMVACCWLAWMAGDFCRLLRPQMGKWAYAPFAMLLCETLYQFPPHTTPQMVEYTAWSMVVCGLTLLLGVVLATAESQAMRLACAIAFTAVATEALARLHGHLAYLIWAKSWMAGWLVGLLVVAAAAVKAVESPHRTPTVYSQYPARSAPQRASGSSR